MRHVRFISAGFWIDGCGAGIVIGLAVASHIEGRGLWQYAPALLAIMLPLIALAIVVARVTVAQAGAANEQVIPSSTENQTPEAATLVLAWKPLINGWDVVLGRQVTDNPATYTHWLPLPRRPE